MKSTNAFLLATLLLHVSGVGAFAQGPLADTSITLPFGTAVTLILEQDVAAARVVVGQEVTAYVATDLRVGGLKVLTERAPARFLVSEQRRAGLFGRPDHLVLRADHAVAVDGSRIPLDGYFGTTGQDRMVESLASSQVVGCFFFLVPGDRIVLGKGTGWTTQVRRDTPIRVPNSNR